MFSIGERKKKECTDWTGEMKELSRKGTTGEVTFESFNVSHHSP